MSSHDRCHGDNSNIAAMWRQRIMPRLDGEKKSIAPLAVGLGLLAVAGAGGYYLSQNGQLPGSGDPTASVMAGSATDSNASPASGAETDASNTASTANPETSER